MTRVILFFTTIVLLISCRSKTEFELINSGESGIKFSNLLTESDSMNVLDVENIYNGGGVGVGDFNNDGLTDLYFTGNMVPGKMYINKGDFRFTDVTEAANTGGDGRW